MTPPPIAIGLTICEKVIIEEGSRNATLVSTFSKLNVDGFPSPPQRFVVYAVLADGHGGGRMELVLTHMDSEEVIDARETLVYFPDRLTRVRVVLRFTECTFPAPGEYEFT